MSFYTFSMVPAVKGKCSCRLPYSLTSFLSLRPLADLSSPDALTSRACVRMDISKLVCRESMRLGYLRTRWMRRARGCRSGIMLSTCIFAFARVDVEIEAVVVRNVHVDMMVIVVRGRSPSALVRCQSRHIGIVVQ